MPCSWRHLPGTKHPHTGVYAHTKPPSKERCLHAPYSAASVPSIDFIRVSAAMGHPELLAAQSGPAPPEPDADHPELDAGPMVW